jgi:AbrB family looped-hinge helix DNA binding protein
VKKTIDNLGRIVIPKELRKELGIAPGDEMNLDVQEGKITIYKENSPEIRIQQAIKYAKCLREKYFRECVAGSNEDLSRLIKILEGSE